MGQRQVVLDRRYGELAALYVVAVIQQKCGPVGDIQVLGKTS